MSFDRADQGKTETIGKDAGAGRTDSQVKQSLEGCRVKLVSIFFMSSSHKYFPSVKTTRTLMVNICHLKGNAPVLRTIPGGFTVMAMERRCVFLFPQCRNFLCCLVRSTFRKTFSVLWVKSETKQKTASTEGQITSTHVITHSNVHNGTHGYDFSA